eukprot:CAMPEP_0194110362 /NCGR_PEP_ID=MMETSP0150-20130528/9643_1 /TAXON_ID=122233 /ORGANISM="Chaetoceros debilis, Strain MM31A-1" /LENGTH=319 /DNA_ID=CAMNT_0038799533 /DNA_START=79 /DNA_END=1035 /DNA_ORIENTATION=+
MSSDPLGDALRSAKAIPKRRSQVPQRRTSSSTTNGMRQHNSDSVSRGGKNKSKSRSKSPNANDRSKEEICSFCGSEPAAVLITKALTQKTTPLCLVHYYTTRACRIDPQKVTFLGKTKTKNQLPYVQDLFAEAFSELQKDISTEAARSFNEMAKKTLDPLSVLNDHDTSSRYRGYSSKMRPSKFKPNSTKSGSAADGGFMSHVQQRETDLIERQKRMVNQSSLAAENSSIQHGNRNINSSLPQKSNPYKRRKKSSVSTWNMVLDGGLDKLLVKQADIEKPDEAIGITCSCGSENVQIFGNITGRNNDVPKAETWGTKRE